MAAPPQAANEYSEVYSSANDAPAAGWKPEQPNYGAPPPYQPESMGPQQPQTRIFSTTNPQPQPTIITPQAQPQVVVMGTRPQYVVVDHHCVEEMQRRRRSRFLMMLLILLLAGPLLGAIIIIPIYT